MSQTRLKDPALVKLRQLLEALYGDRLARVVLFGSRARGDWNDESDYDVAVFLKDLPDWGGELNRLADLMVEVFDQTGAFVDAKPYDIQEWSHRTPLMGEIRRDGVDF